MSGARPAAEEQAASGWGRRPAGVWSDVGTLLPRLFENLKLAVIHGGDRRDPGSVLFSTVNPRGEKDYREVAEDIAGALRDIGFRHVFVFPEDMRLATRLQSHRVDMAWLNSGGVQGYDPVCHLPAAMEMLGLPYVGHNPLNASILDNKHAFKRELAVAGIRTSPYITWDMTRGPLVPHLNSRFNAAFGAHAGPFVVKPVSGRASVHVHVVETLLELPRVVAEVFQATRNLVLIERYLPGREYVVAVAGPLISRKGAVERRGQPFVFSAAERRLQAEEKIFTSMDVRPITGQRLRVLDPDADAEVLVKLEDIARAIWRDFNLETLVRVDVRADESGRLTVLEANPKPDLARPNVKRTSLVCAGLPAHAMSYEDLILSLLINRIDHLMTWRPETMGHIRALAE